MVKLGEGAALRTQRFCGFDPRQGYLERGEGCMLTGYFGVVLGHWISTGKNFLYGRW